MDEREFYEKQSYVRLLPLLAFLAVVSHEPNDLRDDGRDEMPADWFFRQRAYPQGYIDHHLRRLSLEQARQLKTATLSAASAAWVQRGPSNIGSRITTMAISRQNPNVIYVGGADGGVNWTPIFDDQLSLSMGAIAVDPTNDNIVYVGTGNANSSADSYDGFGVVKSTNGGASWTTQNSSHVDHHAMALTPLLSTLPLFAIDKAKGCYYICGGNSEELAINSSNQRDPTESRSSGFFETVRRACTPPARWSGRSFWRELRLPNYPIPTGRD